VFGPGKQATVGGRAAESIEIRETRRSIKKSRDRQRKERVREARNELRMTMAEDDVLFDDVYELCEIIGK
jgi:hypothetical protein